MVNIMVFNSFKFSDSASKRLTKKNIVGCFRNEVETQTHHVSAFLFDTLRFLKTDEYHFLLEKLNEKQLEIINYVAVHADDLEPKPLLAGISQFKEADLTHVFKVLDHEFMSDALNGLEELFELAIAFGKANQQERSFKQSLQG